MTEWPVFAQALLVSITDAHEESEHCACVCVHSHPSGLSPGAGKSTLILPMARSERVSDDQLHHCSTSPSRGAWASRHICVPERGQPAPSLMGLKELTHVGGQGSNRLTRSTARDQETGETFLHFGFLSAVCAF